MSGEAALLRQAGATLDDVADIIEALIPSVLDLQDFSAGVVNSTSETTVYTFTLPANTIIDPRVITLDYIGDILNTTGGNVTYTFRLKLGGVTIFQSSATIASGVDRGAAHLKSLITPATLSEQRCATELSLGQTTSNEGTGVTPVDSIAVDAAPGQDATTALALNLTAQMDTASTGAAVRRLSGNVRIF